MGFPEIEDALGFALPASARNHPAWWANDPTPGRHSHAWLCAGWETEDLDLGGEQVTFRRSVDIRPSRADRANKHSPTARKTSADASAFAGLPPAECDGNLHLSLGMQWRTLGVLLLDEERGLQFPTVPNVPGLYRFRLTGKGGTSRYIGETANLRRRFQHYRNPGPTQATNIRINQIFQDHLQEGGEVTIDVIMGEVQLTIAGAAAQVDLADKPTRRLLEHAAIVAEGSESIDSLNR